jgi:hypothetical protein
MPALRQTPLLRAHIDENCNVVWHGIDGKRWQTIKEFLNKDVEISIGPYRKIRSGRQNRYYWKAIVATLQEAMGCTTKEEAHDVLRLHLLVEHHDEGPATIKSTATMTTVETEEYYARCRQVIAEWFGIYVPLPNEVIES